MLALFLYPQYARKEVNAMPYIPKDQIVAAREMDLLTYLRRFEPEELVHIGGDTEACPRMGQTLSRKSAGERRLKIVH